MRTIPRIPVAAAALQSKRVSIKAFVQSSIWFFFARVEDECRVQPSRRPDAAEKSNNLALILVHGSFKGSFPIPASERVTLIQWRPRAALAAAAPVFCRQVAIWRHQQFANFKMNPKGRANKCSVTAGRRNRVSKREKRKRKTIRWNTSKQKLGGCARTLGCMHSHRIWRKSAACKLQDDLCRQRELMQCYRWEKSSS